MRDTRGAMTTPHLDPELLAAFLDGAVTPDERSRVLQTIAASPEAYAEFAEAAAIREALHANEMSAAPAASTAPPLPARWRRIAVPLSLLAAAGVAITVAVRLRPATGRADAFAVVAQATNLNMTSGSGSLSARLGPDWERAGWSLTRGTGDDIAPPARAFRAGLRAAQLEAAVGARDSIAIGNAVLALEQLLAETPGAGPTTTQLRSLASNTATIDADGRRVLAGQLSALLGAPDAFDLGVWVGTAQIAARAGDARFFAPGGAGSAYPLRELSDRLRASSGAAAAMVDSLAASGSSGAADLVATQRWLAQVVVLMGN